MQRATIAIGLSLLVSFWAISLFSGATGLHIDWISLLAGFTPGDVVWILLFRWAGEQDRHDQLISKLRLEVHIKVLEEALREILRDHKDLKGASEKAFLQAHAALLRWESAGSG